VSNSLGLTELILVGKGMTGRAERPSSLAAGVLESVIAAIYIDGGHEAAREFILRHMEQHIAQFAATTHQQNFKSLLQQYAQQELSATPMYELVDEKGPDHSKCFEVRVVIGPRAFSSAWGPAKKQAEQRAAELALMEMGVLPAPAERGAVVAEGEVEGVVDAVPLEESAEAEGLADSSGAGHDDAPSI
jgi:ribonuclease-3